MICISDLDGIGHGVLPINSPKLFRHGKLKQPGIPSSKRSAMRYRVLGKTGLEVSEVGFGAIPIIRLSHDEAVRVLRRALDRGITLFDTAHLYVDSEEKIGQAFAGVRPRVVLATKTIRRDYQGAQADLELKSTPLAY
jgi:hypothetical protein